MSNPYLIVLLLLVSLIIVYNLSINDFQMLSQIYKVSQEKEFNLDSTTIEISQKIDASFQTLEWYQNQTLNKGLPSSIKVFSSNSSVTQGVPLFSVYAEVDLFDPNLNFKVIYGNKSSPMQSPSQFYTQTPNSHLIINGGFFNIQTGQSLGLLIDQGILITPNVQNQGKYHPTIGTFGMYANKSIEGLWTYNPTPTSTWSYQQPAENSKASPPLPPPNNTWPQGAQPYKPFQAMSAGPLLLKNGVYYDGAEELFSDNILYNRHPRSAVCKTNKGKLVFMAIDGRRKESTGVFLNETAEIMRQVGCVDGLNLDGGGSTCLLVDNIVANQPSDGRQRPVANALVVYSTQ